MSYNNYCYTYEKNLEKRRDLKFIHLEFLFLQPFLLMFHSQIAFILLTYLQEKKSIHNKKNTILRLFYIHSNLFHLKIAKAAAPGGRGGEERGRRGKIGEGGGRRGKPLKIIYLLFHFLHNARRKSKTFLKKLFLEQEKKKIKISFFHQKE